MTLADLRALVSSVPITDLPTVVAELEACKALAWLRLVAGAAQSMSAADSGAHKATAEHIAEVFNVPVSQIYEQARQGRLPCVKLGKYVRFNIEQVKAALAQGSGSETVALGTRKKRSKSKAETATATTMQPQNGAAQ